MKCVAVFLSSVQNRARSRFVGAEQAVTGTAHDLLARPPRQFAGQGVDLDHPAGVGLHQDHAHAQGVQKQGEKLLVLPAFPEHAFDAPGQTGQFVVAVQGHGGMVRAARRRHLSLQAGHAGQHLTFEKEHGQARQHQAGEQNGQQDAQGGLFAGLAQVAARTHGKIQGRPAVQVRDGGRGQDAVLAQRKRRSRFPPQGQGQLQGFGQPGDEGAGHLPAHEQPADRRPLAVAAQDALAGDLEYPVREHHVASEAVGRGAAPSRRNARLHEGQGLRRRGREVAVLVGVAAPDETSRRVVDQTQGKFLDLEGRGRQVGFDVFLITGAGEAGGVVPPGPVLGQGVQILDGQSEGVHAPAQVVPSHVLLQIQEAALENAVGQQQQARRDQGEKQADDGQGGLAQTPTHEKPHLAFLLSSF